MKLAGFKFKIKILIYKFTEFLIGKGRVKTLHLNFCLRFYKKYKIIFIHIPRTGGTSVAKMLFGRRCGHFYASEIRENLGFEIYRKLTSFVITRNPYDRLISAYEFLKQGGGKDGSVRFEKEFALPAFKNFSSFVKDWLIHQNKAEVNLLFRPQHFFIFDINGIPLVNCILKLEDTDSMLRFFQENKLGTLNIKRSNSSKREKIDNYYDAVLKDLVYEYYKIDFQLLNYVN